MVLGDVLTALLVGVAAFAAWIVSTLGGGGGGLLLVPAVGFLVGAQAVAPVVTLASMAGGPARVYLFLDDVNWAIVRWYLPGAVVGGFVGAWLFTEIQAEWLQLILGLFLVSTVLQYRFGKRERTFPMRVWMFLPAGLLVSFFSGLVGTTGPVLNPLYLNYGAVKEEMIGTKSVSSLAMHLVKIGTYVTLGTVGGAVLLYGVAAGVAAAAAGWVGKHLLAKVTKKQFRQVVVAVMVVSGAAMLWEQRELLVELVGVTLT